jgi:SAM-dependent methyltransferase
LRKEECHPGVEARGGEIMASFAGNPKESSEKQVEFHKYDVSFYPEIAFGGIPRYDGVIEFYSRLNSIVTSKSVVVDFGCGRGSHTEDPVEYRRNLRNLRGKAAKVIGLDVDPAGQSNPSIDEFRKMNPSQRWPVEDATIDVVLADCVLEHLPDPGYLFREAARVLVSRGFLCIVTTNLLSYVGVAAKLTPNSLHSRVLSKTQLSREEKDVFPTLYRCNTVFALRREMERHGFDAAVFGHDGGPGYLRFSKIAYALGFLHQSFTPSFIKPTLMAFGKKQR